MMASTSVIIPVRNGTEYITIAIDSALAQLGAADEVIVVDDHSTDETAATVRKISDGRVTLMPSSGHGVSAARNCGISRAGGEFVAFLDHDDRWSAGRHQALLDMLRDNPEVDAAFGRIRVVIENGARNIERIAAMDGRHVGVASVGTGLFRRSIVNRIDGFDESMAFGEDVDFFIRLSEAGMRVVDCDVDALIYRRHSKNSSNDLAAVERGMADVILRRLLRRRAKPVGA